MNIYIGDVWKAVLILKARLYTTHDVIVADFDTGIAIIKKKKVNQNQIRNSNILNTKSELKMFYEYLNTLTTEDAVSTLNYQLLNKHRMDLLLLYSIQDVRDWL